MNIRLVAVLLVMFTSGAAAQDKAMTYTCNDVIWAVDNLPRETLETIKSHMTEDQLRQARECLRNRKQKERKSK